MHDYVSLIDYKYYNILQREDFSSDLRRFLDRCLTVSVDERAGAGELLGHAFIKNNAGSTVSLIPNIMATKDKNKKFPGF